MTMVDERPTDTAVAVAASPVEAAMKSSVRQALRRQRKATLGVRLIQIVILTLFLGGWELGYRNEWFDNGDLFFGSPWGVVNQLWDDRGDLWGGLTATIKAASIGFAIGSLAAMAVGILVGQIRFADRVLDPFFVVLTGIPRIALAPLFVLWFGITDKAKIALSISLVFFVVLFNMRAGVRGVDRDLVTVSRTLGANRIQQFLKVTLPSSVPVLFAGFRLAIAFSILGVIASEMTASRAGLGREIIKYGQTLQPNGVFAVLTLLAVVMSLLNGVLQLVERRLLRWLPD